jgi:CHAT domain-containing protein
MFGAGVEAASLEEREPRKSLNLLDDAIAQANEVGLRYALPQLHNTRAGVLLRLDAPQADVIAELSAGIAALEERQVGAAIADRTEQTGERLYRLIVALLLRTNDVDGALRYADRYRVYALRSLQTPQPARVRGASDPSPRFATLSYLFTPDGLFAFVARDGAVHAVRIGASEANITSATAELWPPEGQAGLQQRALKQLSALLLQPVERLLNGTKLIAVIPDGALYSVPFAALLTSSGVPLAERHSIVRTQFAHVQRGSNATWSSGVVLVFGNPAFDRTAFGYLPKLPSAEDEAKRIASLYPDPYLFIGSGATLGAFVSRSPTGSIIQVAAHGLPGGDDPLNSALLFAPDRAGASGVLYAKDVLRLNLRGVCLVVLSACSTGGSAYTFSGASMADAFVAAGAQHVLGTLSRVDDNETMRFITSFHQRVRRHVPVIQAFHETQLEFIEARNYSDVWASFELTVHAI